MNTKPEVVVVTGARAGLGRAIVREFARHGASIGLLARGDEELEAVRREVEQLGGRAVAVPTDMADANQVEAAADKIEQALGPIDIWINDAMATIFAPVDQISPDDFKRVTEVTYLGFVYGTMSALKRMKPRDRGVIVQIGSALAYRAIPLQSPYCGAKHAIMGFTASLRSELEHDKSNVKVTILQMPAMNTPQFDWCKTVFDKHPQPMGKVFQPEVAARAVYYAAHHPRRQFYIGWPSVKAIWGNKFIPGLLDRYLAKVGYAGQLTNNPIPPDRPNNLYRPLPGNYSAHGSFDKIAHKRSPQVWADTHLGWAAIAGVTAAATALWLGLRRRRVF